MTDPMKLGDFLKQSGSVPRQTLVRVAAKRLNLRESSILARPELTLPEEVATLMQQDFEALTRGRPEAYVLGDIPFLDWDFLIDERALIPRPETEDLCARIIQRRRNNPPRKILDLCCGSGVMGLSMALAFPKSNVVLTDLDPAALSLCEENLKMQGMEHRATTKQGDLWQALPPSARFDLIVANPPYVAEDDAVENSVLVNEPHLALYSSDSGMAHIKQILQYLPIRLEPGGFAAFELGHHHQRLLNPWLEARADYENFFWEQDLFGVSRFLFYDCPIAPDKATAERG